MHLQQNIIISAYYDKSAQSNKWVKVHFMTKHFYHSDEF